MLLTKRLLLPCVLLTAISAAAWADSVLPPDPDIGLDGSTLSVPIFQGETFQLMPQANGALGGVFGFFNPSAAPITQFQLQTVVAGGLSPNDFACAVFDYFKQCQIQYTPTPANGLALFTVTFFGTVPERPGESPFDPRKGPAELEGIPPLAPGCADHPDSGISAPPGDVPCTSVGHFLLTFNDNFNFSPNGTGSWNTVLPPGQTNLTFDATQVITPLGPVSAPEPSELAVVAFGCVFGLIAKRRFGHQKR